MFESFKKTNEDSSPCCVKNFPLWHSHRKSSHFTDRKHEATAPNADIRMYHYTKFCFIEFRSSVFFSFPLSPPLWSSPSPPSLIVFPFVMMVRSQFPVSTNALHGSSQQSSTNGNIEYCMLKPCGCCWWPVGVREAASWSSRKSLTVNKSTS